jgi:hypothetical protein
VWRGLEETIGTATGEEDVELDRLSVSYRL